MWARDPKWGYNGVNKQFILKFVLFIILLRLVLTQRSRARVEIIVAVDFAVS